MEGMDRASQIIFYKRRAEQAELKLHKYRLALETYANPLTPYDKGSLARKTLELSNKRSFKPKRLDDCTFNLTYVEFIAPDGEPSE